MIREIVDAMKKVGALRAGYEPLPGKERGPEFALQEDACNRSMKLAELARTWQNHPFSEHFLAHIDSEIASVHNDLLAGKIDGPTYARFFAFARNIGTLAQRTMDSGEKAKRTLDEWRRDGTLDEIAAYRLELQNQPKEET